MSMRTFLQHEILLPRLQRRGVLVAYDPNGRYRESCLELASDTRWVIDASESSIESRAAALAALRELGLPNTALKELLVYVPAKAPVTDEDRQRDPFALYAACGAIFPEGDGDEYLSLCLRYKADHATEIRRIFGDNPNPSFDVIDAVGGGAGWPQLRTLLHVDSARDILFALLAPTEAQKTALKGQEAWLPEAKALFQSALGLNLLTRSKSWGPVADELWRFLLFSEFTFDLPVALPAALVDVPRARPEARLLVDDLCDRLRNDQRTQARYIERAEGVEQELNLPAACRAIPDLGVRDTFPFEERSFFSRAVDALKRDNLDQLRQTLARRAESVWAGRGENRVQWNLLGAAVSLMEACEDADRQLPENARSQDALLDFYLGSLREVDRRQRELEQAAGDAIIADGQMTDVLRQARTAYRKLADKVQGVFVRHLEKSGWPPAGRLANADVFDKLVAPKLAESGHRVALLLIDALRYELGVELQKQLSESGQVALQAAYAQLPSITPVGMASLLPGAGRDLKLTRKEDELRILLGEQPLVNVGQRIAVLRQRFGQRFAEATLKDFVRGPFTLPAGAELLVLRSNDMDNDFEANPEAAPGLINRTLQQIRAALHKLADLGFADAVIATDHGFYLNTAIEAGDICAKPRGNWLNVHDRLLLGDGASDAANFVIGAAQLGIRGDINQAAGPRAMVAYAAGAPYCHGGASLQEAVVPVLAVRLRVAEEPATARPTVKLGYSRASKRITTRVPVVDVAVGGGDLFYLDKTVTVLIEAQDKAGNVVGEASPGGPVNPATLTLSLQPDTAVRVTLRMNSDFEGKFTVKALDPVTLTVYDKLDLETDYTV
jgi:hypothetical protein